jgi:hypothetical protein
MFVSIMLVHPLGASNVFAVAFTNLRSSLSLPSHSFSCLRISIWLAFESFYILAENFYKYTGFLLQMLAPMHCLRRMLIMLKGLSGSRTGRMLLC